jgi:hypothetical protein
MSSLLRFNRRRRLGNSSSQSQIVSILVDSLHVEATGAAKSHAALLASSGCIVILVQKHGFETAPNLI